MKKLIVFGLFLNAALLAGRFWQELPQAVGGEKLTPATDERFCADSDGDGELTYLIKDSRHRRSRLPIDRDERYDEFLRFHLEKGDRDIRLSFEPISHILASAATILGLFGFSGLLAGSLTRHSLSERELFGIRNASLDPTWELRPFSY